MQQDLKGIDADITELKRALKERESNIKALEKGQGGKSNDGILDKEFSKQKKELLGAKQEIKTLKEKLAEMKKRCNLLEEEDEKEADEVANADSLNGINPEEILKKQLDRYKRQVRKKEREMEELREQKNKLLQDNLEQKQTIRHLNSSLDLMKITIVDNEVSRATSTKTNSKEKNTEESEDEDDEDENGSDGDCGEREIGHLFPRSKALSC